MYILKKYVTLKDFYKVAVGFIFFHIKKGTLQKMKLKLIADHKEIIILSLET